MEISTSVSYLIFKVWIIATVSLTAPVCHHFLFTPFRKTVGKSSTGPVLAQCTGSGFPVFSCFAVENISTTRDFPVALCGCRNRAGPLPAGTRTSPRYRGVQVIELSQLDFWIGNQPLMAFHFGTHVPIFSFCHEICLTNIRTDIGTGTSWLRSSVRIGCTPSVKRLLRRLSNL